jgi:hypothetical protein
MPQITVKGKVVYGPGAWGSSVPARNVTVQVVDVDLPGAGDDTLWTGTTDTTGAFSGTTSNWQDSRTLQVWVPNLPPPLGPGGGRWESRTEPDPTDVLALKVRVTEGSRSQDFFPFANDAPLPLILPWAPASWSAQVAKSERALLVVSHLAGNGPGNWQWLYRFLDTAGVQLAEQIMGPAYGRMTRLTGDQATRQGFLNALCTLASDAAIRAVDVIINLHGSSETLWFKDGGVPMSTLKSNLTSLNLAPKLRMAYSTACYGASHADQLVEAGFNAAVGAVGVNANSPTEYPTVLTLWAAGRPLAEAVAAGEVPATRIPADQAATSVGFTGVNSDKTITGDGGLTIGVNAG